MGYGAVFRSSWPEETVEPTVAHLETHLENHAVELREWMKREQRRKSSSHPTYSIPIYTKVQSLYMRADWWGSQRQMIAWRNELALTHGQTTSQHALWPQNIRNAAVASIRNSNYSKRLSHEQAEMELFRVLDSYSEFDKKARKSRRASCGRAHVLHKHINKILSQEIQLLTEANIQLHKENKHIWYQAIDYMDMELSEAIIAYEKAVGFLSRAPTKHTHEAIYRLQMAAIRSWTLPEVQLLLGDDAISMVTLLLHTNHNRFKYYRDIISENPCAKDDLFKAPLSASNYWYGENLQRVLQFQRSFAPCAVTERTNMSVTQRQLTALWDQNQRSKFHVNHQLAEMHRRKSRFQETLDTIQDYLDEKRGLDMPIMGEAAMIKDWEEWKPLRDKRRLE